jgi:hypothetical protein
VSRRGVSWVVAAVCALACLGAIAGGGIAARLPSPDPKEMVLQLGDLPAGFGKESGKYVSNVQVARKQDVSIAELRRWGRVIGYDVVFGKKRLVGLSQVDSSANTYETPGGAHDSFREQVAAATGPNDRGLVFKRLSTGGAIGHESRLYVARTKSGGVTVDVYAVVWRYSRVTAAVIGAGIAATVDAHVVVDLARKQQRHILAAVG